MNKPQKLKRLNQAGVVSILVTMIMMLVITLIVIGMSQVTRRNSREALDRQLSTAAYYAAESGVNDAVSFLTSSAGKGFSSTSADQTQCGSFTTDANSKGASPALNSTLNSSTNTGYTCLLVNTHPTSLTQRNVAMGNNTVWKVASYGGLPIQTLKFSFGLDSSSTNTGSCTDTIDTLKPATTRCKYGVMQVDLLQLNADGTLPGSPNSTAQTLAAATRTVYIQPTTSGSAGAVSFSNATNSYVYGCQIIAATNTCDATITGLTSPAYYARMSMLYSGSDVITLTGTVAGGASLLFDQGQAVIDSTGKSQDELRRLQVRVPLTSGNDSAVPSNALQTTQDICKHFEISTSDPNPSAVCQP